MLLHILVNDETPHDPFPEVPLPPGQLPVRRVDMQSDKLSGANCPRCQDGVLSRIDGGTG